MINANVLRQRQSGQSSKILLAVLVLTLLLGSAGIWWYFFNPTLRIAITDQQILDRLSQKLPVTETYLFAFEVTYDSPRVALIAASERIHAGLDISLRIRFLPDQPPLQGRIDAAAGIRYDRVDEAFYLTDPKVETLTLEGLPEEWANKARDLVAEGVRVYFNDHPVYKLSERESDRAAKAILQDISIEDDRIIVHLGPREANRA